MELCLKSITLVLLRYQKKAYSLSVPEMNTIQAGMFERDPDVFSEDLLTFHCSSESRLVHDTMLSL